MITVFINVIVPVLIIFAAGYTLGKLLKIDLKTLSGLSLYLLTPALIFQAMYQYKDIFTTDTLKVLLVITIVVAIVIIVVEILYRIFHFSKSLKTVMILTLALSNSGNYGLPICEYAYGSEGLMFASLLLVVYSLYTHTVGVFVAASDKGGRKKALFDMLKVPVFYAMVAALILNYFQIEIPKPIFEPIKTIGLSAIPLNLLQLGISLSRVRLNKNLGVVASVSVIKLALIPFLSIFLLQFFGIGGLMYKVTLTQIAMPPAVYCAILAEYYGSDGELASEIVFISLLMSLLSLTVWIWFFNGAV